MGATQSLQNRGKKKVDPRRSGPWTVLEKFPNKVNFRIREDATGKIKVVHHNRLSPVKSKNDGDTSSAKESGEGGNPSIFTDNESTSSSFQSSSEESENEEENPDQETRRYPLRQRQQRIIHEAIPWEVLDNG